MKCDWQETGSIDARGRTHFACARSQCSLWCYSKYPREKIRSNCQGWPYAYEFGYWAWLLLLAIGVTISPLAWLRRRFGLVEVPECNCEGRKRWLNTLGGRLCRSTNRWSQFVARLLVKRVDLAIERAEGSQH